MNCIKLIFKYIVEMDNVFKLVLALLLTTAISSCSKVSDQEFEVDGVKFKMIYSHVFTPLYEKNGDNNIPVLN